LINPTINIGKVISAGMNSTLGNIFGKIKPIPIIPNQKEHNPKYLIRPKRVVISKISNFDNIIYFN
jgi:hypothetical protein